MPRARSPDRQRAFDLWIESKGKRELKDIAAELGVSPGQVRKWKHADAWDTKAETGKGTLPNGKGNVTKRKKGGQPGNKNAVGNNGGGPPGNKKAFRHGAYERVMGGLLEEDEAEIFSDEETGLHVEEELRRTLAALNAKEVRLIKRINQIRDSAAGEKKTMMINGVNRVVTNHQIGAFRRNADTNALEFMPETAEATVPVPGEHSESTVSYTVPIYEALGKLETELDRTQGRKIKVLAQIEKIHIDHERLELERKRLDGQTEQSQLAKAWIAALIGEGVEDEEDESKKTD